MSDQRKPVLTGGCQCGAIRYAFYAPPERVGMCHCRMCQKAVGGPFFAWANVGLDGFAWTRGAPAVFRSSSASERGFCPRCGTPLTFAYVQRAGRDQRDGSAASIRLSVVTLTQVDGSRAAWSNLDGAAIARGAGRRTGEGSPPEDLTRIAIYPASGPRHASGLATARVIDATRVFASPGLN